MASKWQEVQLRTIADFRNGINYTKESFGLGIRVIGVKDFQDRVVPIYDDLEEINPEGVVKETDLLKEGDILFVRSNGNRQLIGRTLFIKGIPNKITHSAFTIRARFNSHKIEPRFYAYLFRSNLIRNVLSAQGGGTNISNLNQQILGNLKVPLPLFPVQRKIADVLSAYDDLIEVNTRRIRVMEAMAQAVYREWFGKVNEKSLPRGWELTKVGDAFDTVGGSTPSTKVPEYWEGGDINWYSPTDLTANKAMFIRTSGKKITQGGLKNSSAKMFPPYCVMMTSRATIGVISINTTTACTNQGFITCIPNDHISVYQIYYWILDNLELIDNVASGATYKEIGRGELRDFDFLIPDEVTKQKFDEFVSPVGEQIEILLAKNANLQRTRDLLLPRLISGEVEVSELEIGI